MNCKQNKAQPQSQSLAKDIDLILRHRFDLKVQIYERYKNLKIFLIRHSFRSIPLSPMTLNFFLEAWNYSSLYKFSNHPPYWLLINHYLFHQLQMSVIMP